MYRGLRQSTYSTHGLKLRGVLVLKPVGVLDLAGRPGAFVRRVVDKRREPLALVIRVALHGLGPWPAARHVGTLGVGHSWGDPVTVLLIDPVLGLLGLRVGDREGLIDQPILGHGSLLVDDLERCLLVPVLGLRGFRVGDTGFLNPVLRLLVLRVVDLLIGVDGRREVLQETTLLDLFAVPVDEEGVIGMDNERVELGSLDNASGRRAHHVFLLVLASLRVLVIEDEVDLVGEATLVGTEHDDVRRRIRELLLVECLVVAEKLHVSTAAFEAICPWVREPAVMPMGECSWARMRLTLKLNLVLDHEGLILGVNGFGELGRDGMVSCRILDHKALVALHALVDLGFLNSPLADVCPFLRVCGVLLRVGGLPPRVPVAGELLQERSLQRGWLYNPACQRLMGMESRANKTAT